MRADPAISLHESAPAEPAPLLLRHRPEYLDRIAALSARGDGAFDEDTPVSPGTWSATLAAAGAALAALGDALATGGAAFAAIRPPGHHALADRGMGFCFVNHVAVLAAEARRRGFPRVLIVDWDVHHGNGTQALVADEPDTHFVSMHQWPWYPGSGRADERGVENCWNLPLSPGLPPSEYVETLWRGVCAATTAWTPSVVLVSAGYDAMAGDPLGGFTLEPGDFATWTVRLRERFPAAPLVLSLEGGYVPERLAAGVLATVRALG